VAGSITATAAGRVRPPGDLLALFSLGLSYEGRTVWAGKISDNVATTRARLHGLLLRRSGLRQPAAARGDVPV